jgi:hypothetical protein
VLQERCYLRRPGIRAGLDEPEKPVADREGLLDLPLEQKFARLRDKGSQLGVRWLRSTRHDHRPRVQGLPRRTA